MTKLTFQNVCGPAFALCAAILAGAVVRSHTDETSTIFDPVGDPICIDKCPFSCKTTLDGRK